MVDCTGVGLMSYPVDTMNRPVRIPLSGESHPVDKRGRVASNRVLQSSGPMLMLSGM